MTFMLNIIRLSLHTSGICLRERGKRKKEKIIKEKETTQVKKRNKMRLTDSKKHKPFEAQMKFHVAQRQ